ncbi:MAG: FMN-binding glutamate synthase family protein [Candidatus Altiarchaeota archaeon]|nr:FMN-binding glutamate synthase family protein [Candidatus Altiarchaeota archaeon]
MAETYGNSRSTSGTMLRTKDTTPVSGMCPICIEGCGVLCEIGKSAFRGREVLYPDPTYFGTSTAASCKDYLLDWSDFQIMVDVRSTKGIEPDSDKALFINADIKTKAGGVPLSVPVTIAGLGSTAVAKRNWDGLSVGAAISGTIQVIGENVCGMDPKAKFDADGKVTDSEDLKYRVEKYREFWDGKNGEIVVQTNVEDQRNGTDLYALSKLEVNVIERKWGQGAKAIGGEVRIKDLEKALMLKKRGYLVEPDPEEPKIQEAFKNRVFESFERHSRVGMVDEQKFLEDIAWLREQGAKKVFLKTGAYRPAVVALTMKLASEAKIDLLTFDGAGGGTGMSPVPMMNEASTPTVYLQAQVLKCAQILKKKNKYVPDILMAGGFINEGQIFKSMALSNYGGGPFVKGVATGRSPITAVMKAKHYVDLAKKDSLPKGFAALYGNRPEQFFIATTELGERFGADSKKIPWEAIGLYTYFTDRIGVGLQQLMAGSRKWKLDLLDRGDIASLTETAKRVTGIPLVDEVEQDVMEQILA